MADIAKRTVAQLWGDVIFALFVRQLRSEFNDKLGLAWAVVQPVLFIMIMSLIRGRLDGGMSHGMDTFVFMMLGIVPMKAFILGFGKIAGAVKRDKPLYSFRQVRPFSSLVTALVLQMLTMFFVVIILGLICYLLKIDVNVADPLRAIFLLVSVFVIVFALAILFAMGEQFVPELTKIRALLVMPMFFISGVFFSLNDIPKEYWVYLNWNPFLHIIELLRGACYSNFPIVGVSYGYVLVISAILLFLGLACYHVSWRRAISR